MYIHLHTNRTSCWQSSVPGLFGSVCHSHSAWLRLWSRGGDCCSVCAIFKLIKTFFITNIWDFNLRAEIYTISLTAVTVSVCFAKRATYGTLWSICSVHVLTIYSRVSTCTSCTMFGWTTVYILFPSYGRLAHSARIAGILLCNPFLVCCYIHCRIVLIYNCGLISVAIARKE